MRRAGKRSVRAVVVAAACVVAAMTIVAGAVSWYFYARIEELLVTVSEEQGSALAQALKLAEISNRYAAGTGEIEAARNQVQRQNAVIALAQHAHALREAIAVLDRQPETAVHVQPIKRLVDGLDDALRQQNRLAERRLELELAARRMRADLVRLQAAADVLVSRLAANAEAVHALELAAGRVLLRLYDAGQIDQPGPLQAALADFGTARARFAEAAAALPPAGRGEAERLLATIDALATGPAGLFPTREAVLAVRAEGDRKAIQGREIVTRLGVAVSQLVAKVETDYERTRAAVREQTDAGRHWLLVVALATFLGPVAIVWLAVSRTIVRPLSLLAATTRRIADGDLQAPVPPVHHREFQEIAEALAVFRDTTAALARSEAAHREAREEAEAALADLRNAQEQLIQSEKMAALASVVAGVAHEVNTPLGITLTSASLLADELQAMATGLAGGTLKRSEFEQFLGRAREIAGLVQSNMERAAGLIQAFKQVAADQSSERRRVFDLRETIEQTVVSVRPACDRAGHAIALECPDGIPVDSYPGALSQVLTILVMNSLDHAFEPGRHGSIAIAAVVEESDTLRIDYRDDGRGIAEPLARRVFEPFFTTRRAQGNTGLGLHIAFNIVRQSLKGRIDLDAAAPRGVHFVLRMPAALPLETARSVAESVG